MPFPGLLGVLYRITQVKSRPGIQLALRKGRHYLIMATIRIIIIGESQSHPEMSLAAHSGFLPLGSQRISFFKSLKKPVQKGEKWPVALCPLGAPAVPPEGSLW